MRLSTIRVVVGLVFALCFLTIPLSRGIGGGARRS
jgi:hypothetical protein